MNIASFILIAASYSVVGEGCLFPGISGEGTNVRFEWPWAEHSPAAPDAPAEPDRPAAGDRAGRPAE